MTIEVQITNAELSVQGNETLKGIRIVDKLKAAGVPVIGNISLLGVERGALTLRSDAMFDALVYLWEDDQ